MKNAFKKFITVSLVAVLSIVVFTACKSGDGAKETAKVEDKKDEAKEEKKELTLGTSPGPYDVLFIDAIKPILEKKGYTIKTIDFAELQLSNIAISEGSVDFNASQHTAYMNNFNKNKNTNLAAVTYIPTVPAGIFSSKHKSLDAVKKGSKIAVPQDPSNTARALALLQKAGWIKLKDGVELIKATKNDIVENKNNIEITEMDSLQIPRNLDEFDFAVLPGSIVYSAKIDAKTSLLSEDVLKELQLVLTVDGKNKDSKWAKDIAEAYKSKEFKEYMNEHNKDNYWFIPDELK